MNKKTLLIVLLNVFFILVGLGGAATGTIAWFSANEAVTATVSSFQVVAPEGLNFSLYYLQNFSVSTIAKDGNQNVVTKLFSGYERDYQNTPIFSEVEFDGEGKSVPIYYGANGTSLLSESDHKNDRASCTSAGEWCIEYDYSLSQDVVRILREDGDFDNGYIRNPTDIQQLWPARKLTFAIATEDSLSRFSLGSGWLDNTISQIVDNSARQIRLSWAINIYGKATPVTKTNDVFADIVTGYYSTSEMAVGYSSYYSYLSGTPTDCFDFGPASPHSQNYGAECNIVTSFPAATANQRTILFFTIEFSNDPSTWYIYDKTHDYYRKPVTTEEQDHANSNCYERLGLSNLQFNLS